MSQDLIDERISRIIHSIDRTVESARKERAKDILNHGESHWTISRWDSFIHGLTTSKEFIEMEFKN
jgi:hypothetical protein